MEKAGATAPTFAEEGVGPEEGSRNFGGDDANWTVVDGGVNGCETVECT